MNAIGRFSFFSSYAEALEQLNQRDQKELLYAIIRFVFHDEEPIFKKGSKQALVWTLIFPNLQTSKNKAENSKKENQKKIKSESNENQT